MLKTSGFEVHVDSHSHVSWMNDNTYDYVNNIIIIMQNIVLQKAGVT